MRAPRTGRPAQFTRRPRGERNALTVDRTASGEVQFTDAVTPIVAGLLCLPIPLGQALCDPDGDPRDLDGGGVRVDLGDRDDRAIVRGIPRSDGKGALPAASSSSAVPARTTWRTHASAFIRFEGGAGDDTLVVGRGRGRGAHRRHGRGRHRVQRALLRHELRGPRHGASG